MATIKTSPMAQGVALQAVRKQYPTLSNKAQVAVWKYGADACAAVYLGKDDGSLRGMQRAAAKLAGQELHGLDGHQVALADIIGTRPAPPQPTSKAPAKRNASQRPYSSAHTAKFTRKQLDVMAEIAASARKHASK